MLVALPYALRFALLCWYCALVANGFPWWGVPLLVMFATGFGCGKLPNFSSASKPSVKSAQSADQSNQVKTP